MKRALYLFKINSVFLLSIFFSCNNIPSSNQEMLGMISTVAKYQFTYTNPFCPEAQLSLYDSIVKNSYNYAAIATANYCKSDALLEMGDEKQSVDVLESLFAQLNPRDVAHIKMVKRNLGIAYMRLGEKTNCVYNHTAESCIFPIQDLGIHQDKTGASKAIQIYESLLKDDANDLESRWLLNIAYMISGGYPNKVPAAFLIKGLDNNDTVSGIKPFTDVAVNIGLNTKNMAGGNIVDDFNNDGYLDIVTSSWSLNEKMHYCRNNGDGSFTDISDSSGLGAFTGGLNMMQIDYNNDGYKDIFVLRGAWKGEFGREPNSLFRNNGNGTFTDVTKQSGLLSFHPTQTATWNDFNNDGWIDVFIGNESRTPTDEHFCELYMSNKNGTFTNTAIQSQVDFSQFVKGVTSGDYDNDGLADIFISTLDAKKILLKNMGVQNGIVKFKDVTQQAGLGNCTARTFPTWFWDYDNDGWLDIFVCSYDFEKSLAWYAAAEATGVPLGGSAKQYLFRNKHDGTFEDITDKAGLNKTAFAMGSNFGDIDNDGYPDIYLGTGNPLYQSLVPNKMFRNNGGVSFTDITSAARTGNLQKGHGVSFADLDNDGDEDIYIEMGGAYSGDAYQNSLYINPGQNNNNWINISLEGTTDNRAAIGARIKVTFTENGKRRSVYHDLNSGGSFGSNPLLQHIGIGTATSIESIEINWPVSKKVQVFKALPINKNIKIKQDKNSIEYVQLNQADFTVKKGLISCAAN